MPEFISLPIISPCTVANNEISDAVAIEALKKRAASGV